MAAPMALALNSEWQNHEVFLTSLCGGNSDSSPQWEKVQ